MEPIRQISPQHALRLCVKAKQTDSSELASIRLRMRGAHAEKGSSALMCEVDGQLAIMPHQGYYSIPGGRLLVPLHDDSFILVESRSGDGAPVCSGFSLVVGSESLGGIRTAC